MEAKILELALFRLETDSEIKDLKNLVCECSQYLKNETCRPLTSIIPDLGLGIRPLLYAYITALHAFEKGNNVARSVDIEMLLRLFGTRQINEVLKSIEGRSTAMRKHLIAITPAYCIDVMKCVEARSVNSNLHPLEPLPPEKPVTWIVKHVYPGKTAEHINGALIHLEVVALSQILFKE